MKFLSLLGRPDHPADSARKRPVPGRPSWATREAQPNGAGSPLTAALAPPGGTHVAPIGWLDGSGRRAKSRKDQREETARRLGRVSSARRKSTDEDVRRSARQAPARPDGLLGCLTGSTTRIQFVRRPTTRLEKDPLLNGVPCANRHDAQAPPNQDDYCWRHIATPISGEIWI